jgi:predicted phage terminase large subunit-like protein
MEVTEPWVAGGFLKNKVSYSDIESNNGGRGFARKINEICNPIQGRINTQINWFHQSGNKESRIISNAATVKQRIVFPDDWHLRWPDFYNDVVRFKRNFKSNEHDDAADTLTGITEKMDDIQTGSMFLTADML